jgi:hypothetical protein
LDTLWIENGSVRVAQRERVAARAGHADAERAGSASASAGM